MVAEATATVVIASAASEETGFERGVASAAFLP